MVANAVVYRRYAGALLGRSAWPTLAFLGTFSLVALSFTLVWKLAPPERGVRAGLLAACAAVAVATVAAFQALVPQAVAELGKKFRWGIIFYVILRPPRMNVKYGLLIQQIPTKQE